LKTLFFGEFRGRVQLTLSGGKLDFKGG